MKEGLKISVSTVNGTKHYYIGKYFKKILYSLLAITLAGILIALVSVLYLRGEVDFVDFKQKEQINLAVSFTENIELLNTLKLNLESDLLDREERILSISDRLGSLEAILDVNDAGDADKLESRLDTAAITSLTRMILLSQIPSGEPVINARHSSGYGKRIHPLSGKVTTHWGFDFAVRIGTPIYSPAEGVISMVRPSDQGSGNFVRIMHSYGFTSSYSHLSKFAVERGDFVYKGQLLGYSGNTGISSGPHLHYEVRFLGRALDPEPFVDWQVESFDSIFSNVSHIKWNSLINKMEKRASYQLQIDRNIPSR